MFNFFNKGLIVGAALLLASSGYLYLRLEITKESLEKVKKDLNIALQINKDNEKKFKELSENYQNQIKILNEANNENNQLKDKIIHVKEYIYKNNENNLTKFFNNIVSRLWGENFDSGNN